MRLGSIHLGWRLWHYPPPHEAEVDQRSTASDRDFGCGTRLSAEANCPT